MSIAHKAQYCLIGPYWSEKEQLLFEISSEKTFSYHWDERNAKTIKKDRPRIHPESFFIEEFNDDSCAAVKNAKFLKFFNRFLANESVNITNNELRGF